MKIDSFSQDYTNEDACLEWLKNELYPDGILCHVCHKITKHHKALKKRFYICDSCGNHVHPTAGTIFRKSSTPLRIWFQVMRQMLKTRCKISAKEIQRETGVTYKTAWRMVNMTRKLLDNNFNKSAIKDQPFMPLSFSYPDDGIEVPVGQKKTTGKFYSKRDRTARLLKIQRLLYQNPQGLSVKEIASKCSVSKRTTYRDLVTLETEMDFPIWEEGSKRGVNEGFFLPPVNFTVQEAINIYFSSRMMLYSDHVYVPVVASTFSKLNSIAPTSLRGKMQEMLDDLEKRHFDLKANILKRTNNVNQLVKAWLSQHKIKFVYQCEDELTPQERVVEPWSFEPTSLGGSFYVIGYCNLKKDVCAFKMHHILGEVAILPDTYKIPPDFNQMRLLEEAWGVHFGKEILNVKLHLKPRRNRSLRDIFLHPSQSVEKQSDGSMIVSLKVRDIDRFRYWILSCGDRVEVLKPLSLRNQVSEIAKSIWKIYQP